MATLPGFYGFISDDKGADLVSEHFLQSNSRHPAYLYHFSSDDLASLVLAYVDKFGDMKRKIIFVRIYFASFCLHLLLFVPLASASFFLTPTGLHAVVTLPHPTYCNSLL